MNNNTPDLDKLIENLTFQLWPVDEKPHAEVMNCICRKAATQMAERLLDSITKANDLLRFSTTPAPLDETRCQFCGAYTQHGTHNGKPVCSECYIHHVAAPLDEQALQQEAEDWLIDAPDFVKNHEGHGNNNLATIWKMATKAAARKYTADKKQLPTEVKFEKGDTPETMKHKQAIAYLNHRINCSIEVIEDFEKQIAQLQADKKQVAANAWDEAVLSTKQATFVASDNPVFRNARITADKEKHLATLNHQPDPRDQEIASLREQIRLKDLLIQEAKVVVNIQDKNNHDESD